VRKQAVERDRHLLHAGRQCGGDHLALRQGEFDKGEGLGGLPLVKPPSGVMAAIDLKNGSLLFQVPPVSGGNYRGEYISLALPQTSATTTQQGRQ
jgi:hypothetical protein